MLMMLQNLDNAATAVVVDTSDYITLAAPAAVGAQGIAGNVSVAARDDAVAVEAE